MDETEMRRSVLSAEIIAKADAELRATALRECWAPVQLTLYGIRIGHDGAVLGVFTDCGGTARLRESIASSVSPFVDGSRLKYRKPFVHVTLARILSRLRIESVLALFDKQRRYMCLDHGVQTVNADAVFLGRESRWMHAEVELLTAIALPALANRGMQTAPINLADDVCR